MSTHIYVSSEPSLREKQTGMLKPFIAYYVLANIIAVLERMLNLNVDKTEEVVNSIEKSETSDPLNAVALDTLKDNAQSTWKVLVFDSLGRDIISSVLRVNDLFKVCEFPYDQDTG